MDPGAHLPLLALDDMGYSDLGCYGAEIKTPNLDRLASKSLRFTDSYNTARCCPSRAALLTGLYSPQAGMGGMNNDQKKRSHSGTFRIRLCHFLPVSILLCYDDCRDATVRKMRRSEARTGSTPSRSCSISGGARSRQEEFGQRFQAAF